MDWSTYSKKLDFSKVKKFQNQLQASVQDLNTNFTDQAQRLRNQVAQQVAATAQTVATSPLLTQPPSSDAPGPSPGPSPSKTDGAFVRLPVESAKKLRWYDQHDVKMLIQLHLREKHELHQANAVLREALQRVAGGSQPEMVASVLHTVDTMRAEEEAINGILVLSASAEVERLQEEVSDLSAELQAVQERLSAGMEAAPLPEVHTPRTGADGEEVEATDEQEGEVHEGCASCASLRSQIAAMSRGQAEAVAAKESAERQAAKARAKSVEVQQAQIDVVRLAQDERLQAESRCEAAEAKATAETKKAEKLQRQVDSLAELASASSSTVAKLEAELANERSKGAAQATADAAAVRKRTIELEAAVASLTQQLTASTAQVAALETRLAASEAAAARAVADARDMEAAASECDGLAVRLAAADARLAESRAAQLTAGSLREMLDQSESRRVVAEEELITTAKLASELEAKLTEATMAAERAVIEAQEAALRATAAWEAVEEEVERRWEDAGTDKSRWPAKAQDELEAVEARVAALISAHKNAQEKLKEDQAALEAADKRAAAAEQKVANADGAVERVARSAEQRERRLEAAALAAARQVDEFRAALAKMERERDRLVEEKKVWDSAAASFTGMKRRVGGGSISDGLEATSSNGSEVPAAGPPVPHSGTVPRKEGMDATDIVYLKNVLMKFLLAHMEGRHQECDVLLPALAAVLRATPPEFQKLRGLHAGSHAVLGWLTG